MRPDLKENRLFLASWNAASLIALSLPLVAFFVARRTKDYQDQFKNEYVDDNPMAEYDEYGRYIGSSHWWQFTKKNYNNDDVAEDWMDNVYQKYRAPSWYVWGNDTHGKSQGRGTIVFIYWYTILLIALSFVFGNLFIRRGNLEAFRWYLLFFANYCFVCCVLVDGLGAVEVYEADLEEAGWYGQLAALVFNTCFFNAISALTFTVWISKKIKQRENQKQQYALSEYQGSSF